MDSDLIIKALNYHGQEFRRALDSAAVSDIFENIDMREVDYLQYHQRAKEFGFQERNQRQKLHKFLGRKAPLIYMPIGDLSVPMETDFQSDEIYAVMPPMEHYTGIPGHERRKHFYEVIKKGDPVIGIITALQNCGFVITLICTDGGKRREIYDLGIKCFCTVANTLMNDAHDDAFSLYHIKDLVRGAILNEPANPIIERLYISMKVEHLAFQFQNKLKMGLITEEDLPIHYRRATQFKDKSYSEVLEWNLNFSNPTNVYQIGDSLGLNIHNTESFFRHLHTAKYGKEEYACALRKLQSSKWAFKRIKDGVTQFKAGNHTEAYQCLNKALHIDPESVEGLVARGALFANNNNLIKAVEDFEKALEINPQHGNAQKYLSETLVAIGKRCHEKGDIDGACKNYKRAIFINDSDEAKQALASAEKSLNSKDTTHSRTTSLVDADTRQKLLLLLQDDKEKLSSKTFQPLSPSDVLPTSHKAHSHGMEIPLNLHDDVQLQKLTSSKNNPYEGMNSCHQLENIVAAAKVSFMKDGMGKNEAILTDGDNVYGKKRVYCSSINKSPTSGIATREGPISLEERLKEYYKRVGENDELKQSFTENEISPGEMSTTPAKYMSEIVSGPSEITDSSSRDMVTMHIREGLWTEEHLFKFEHKQRINTIPFSDHSNSSCQRPNTASEMKGNYIIKNKSSKTLNSENCLECFNTEGNVEKKDERPYQLMAKACHRSCRLNNERSLESPLGTTSFIKSQLLDESKFKRKYKNNICRKSHSSDNFDKYSYHSSSRFDGHSSPYYHRSSYSQKSRLSEIKHYGNYHHTVHKYSPHVVKTGSIMCKLNHSKDSEASHRKDRGLICRAPDPEKLRQLRESAKLSRIIKPKYVKKQPISTILKTEGKSALEAAKAAAQKVTEALQHTNENDDDFPVMQKQTLQQMEMFLEKLKSQKKTEAFYNNKND